VVSPVGSDSHYAVATAVDSELRGKHYGDDECKSAPIVSALEVVVREDTHTEMRFHPRQARLSLEWHP
jgi:hypothetical protein